MNNQKERKSENKIKREQWKSQENKNESKWERMEIIKMREKKIETFIDAIFLVFNQFTYFQLFNILYTRSSNILFSHDIQSQSGTFSPSLQGVSRLWLYCDENLD